jgi:hypothetical protein
MDAFNFGSGSRASAFGVGIYEERAKAWWARLTVVPVYRVGHGIHNAWLWLRRRFHPDYQHHIIRTGLEPGWWDCDTLMLHGAFALLVRYVEWECDGADKLDAWSADLIARPDPNAPVGLGEAQASRQMTATDLYRWWKVSKPADEARRDEMCSALFGGKMKSEPVPGTDLHRLIFEEFEGDRKRLYDEFRALEERIDREEQEMLHRLVDIRRSLWT